MGELNAWARGIANAATPIDVIRRGEPEYEQTRRALIWNGRVPDRFPEMIARVRSADEVVGVISTARNAGLRISIRSGGHNWNGSCLRDGSILIDLSELNWIRLNRRAARAQCGPGATNGQLAQVLEEAQLAFPIGHSPDVALGGYLLGGGLGWNPRTWGAACANVRGVEVVLADGTRVTADEDNNQEIYWAARGGGPGLPMVITDYELAVHPLPAAIAGSTYVLPVEATADAAAWLANVAAARLEPGVELTCIVRSGAPLGAEWSGPALVLAPTVFADSRVQAEASLARFQECPAVHSAIRAEVAVPLTLSGSVGRAYLPAGHRYAVDNLWCDGDLVPLLSTVAKQMERAPSPLSLAVVSLTPAHPSDGTAFTMRGTFHVSVYCVWSDEVDDDVNIVWLRETMALMEPGSRGTFAAESDFARPGADPAAAFEPDAWKRLDALRQKIDPTGLFNTYLSG